MILQSTHVVFVRRGLVKTQSYAWNALSGFRWVHRKCIGNSGKLKSNVDSHCRRWLEGGNGLFRSVLLKEVVI